jgi:hypothetical protein
MKRAFDGQLGCNTEKNMIAYDIPTMVSQSLLTLLTSQNIKSVFVVTGTRPFNRNTFTAKDFLPYSVTHPPLQ